MLPVPEGGFTAESVDLECSTIYMEKDRLMGYIVIERFKEDSIILSAAANCTETPKVLMTLIGDVSGRVAEHYPPETTVYVETTSDYTKRMLFLADPKAEEVDRRYELLS
jgi:hypothetical protein